MVDGETWWWWLRSAGGASNFRDVGSGGNSNYDSANYTNGAAPGYCVESDI
jgi:hypothetical protein